MNWFHFIYLLSMTQIVITTTTITQLDGTTLNYSNKQSCENLPEINFVTLNTANPSIELSYQTTESHYAIEIYADLYYIGNWLNKVIEVYIDDMMVDSFMNSDEAGSQSRFCSNGIDTEHRVYAKTFNQYYGALTLKFKIDSTYYDFSLGLRNVQIVQKICHSSCNQCGGPSEKECKSCPLNSTYYRSSKQCKCNAPYNYLLNKSCVIKCEPNQSITDGVCIDDGRLTIISQYFNENIDINGWTVIENNQQQTNIQNKITTKNGIKLFGLFSSNAKISMFLTNNLPNFFRIRFDVYVFASTQIPTFLLTADAITIQITPLHYYMTTTNTDKYTVYHIQTEIDLKANSKISIQLQSLEDLKWGIRELNFNQINCQNNCSACATKLKCSLCQSPFYLYKGTCVQQCPPTSSLIEDKCIDQDEQTPQATYVEFAFWDNQFSKYLTQGKFYILSSRYSQYGINYSNKRYFGGIQSSFFQKIYTNMPPHYNVQISMNVLLIKQNKTSGNLYLNLDNKRFDYSFDETNYAEIQPIKKSAPHSNTNFTLTLFPHNSGNNISLGISNLYIIADLCYPLCRRCTGPLITNCLDWIVEQNSNLESKSCNDGYIFDFKSQKCELCPVGCKTCADVGTCTVCEADFTQQGTGCYCQDGKIDEFTLECKKPQVRFLEEKLNYIRK